MRIGYDIYIYLQNIFSQRMGRDVMDDRKRALVLGKFKFLYQVGKTILQLFNAATPVDLRMTEFSSTLGVHRIFG